MKSYALELIEKGKRIDGRKFDEFRDIEIVPDIIKTAEGSAFVRFGNTKIVAGVKMGLAEPFPDTPDEGTLMVSAEFTPLASPEFEMGPPGEDATELARVVDRGIRESGMIKLEDLRIESIEKEPIKKVWGASVDIHVLNNDGNLIDCAALASVVALLTAKIPKLEGDKITYGEYERPLPVTQKPITVTVCKVGKSFLLDPDVQEEEAIDSKLTIAVREDGKICALQKQGRLGMTAEDISTAIDIALKKSEEIRKLIKV